MIGYTRRVDVSQEAKQALRSMVSRFTSNCVVLVSVAAIAMLSLFASIAAAQTGQTGDATRGKTLYNTWCAGCHGADPRQSQPRLAANRPDVLQDAIALVTQMNFLKSVLGANDIADVAAYIGSVADTGVPVLNPTPGALDFSQQTVGVASASKTLLLTNLGSAALTISSITVTPSDFRANGNCMGRRNPLSTCTLDVTFTPSAAGPVAGKLTVNFVESLTPVTVPLLGSGVLPSSTPVPIVVEFYNPDLDHYFITADAGEQAFVDTGGVGTWLRTGNAYRSGGGAQVCRFHGNPVSGPNSHFYTAGQGECDSLKSSYDATKPSWKFESLDFATTRLVTSQCPDGTVPVYRAYNNGSARGIDSNHRLTTNRTALDQVVARGWIDEGIAMCAPR